MFQTRATPGLRSSPAGEATASSGVAVTVFLRILGRDRNGQAVAEKIAQSRWQGGSPEVRLTAHMGPMTKLMLRPRSWPQTQQRLNRWASACLPGPTTRKSGTPFSSNQTNQGTG